jgi:uncharacterized protein (TIGR00645 family)
MEKNHKLGNIFANIIVASQWLQAPLYFGLIVAQGIMLMVLGLIDVVMISNLLIMVIIGGYHTFVAKIHFSEQNPPDWLDHVNASTMKVKLSMALIGISSIHLLKSFIEIEKLQKTDVYIQMGIHFLFIISAIGLAHVAKMTEGSVNESRSHRKATEAQSQ